MARSYELVSKDFIKKKCEEDIPDNIGLEQNLAHNSLVNAINLANLSKLKCRRRTSQQEADNDENWIIYNADWHVLGDKRQNRCHDDGWEEHSGDERSNQKLGADLRLLGILIQGSLWQSIACKVGTKNNQNQRNRNASRLRNSSSEGVSDERALLEEETLEVWDRGYDDGEQHSPKRRVHECPQSLHESRNAVRELGANPLEWSRESLVDRVACSCELKSNRVLSALHMHLCAWDDTLDSSWSIICGLAVAGPYLWERSEVVAETLGVSCVVGEKWLALRIIAVVGILAVVGRNISGVNWSSTAGCEG